MDRDSLIEWLSTYGWAILVVLAAIGALAYFGVLSPESLLPDNNIAIRNQATNFCNSLNDDSLESGIQRDWSLTKVESKIPVNNYVVFEGDFEFFSYGTDLVNDTLVLWEVVCGVDARICETCDLESEGVCGCNKIYLKFRYDENDFGDD